MEAVKCKNIPTSLKRFGYTIEHKQPIGWMGTTGKYIGWYRLKGEAINRIKELEKNLLFYLVD